MEDPELNLAFRDKIFGMLDDISGNLASIRKQLDRFKSNNDGTVDKQIKDQMAANFRQAAR